MMFCGSQAWVEGIKEVMEPLIILLLAWALGAVIAVSYTQSHILLSALSLSLPPSFPLSPQDIQTSNFISLSLRGGLPAEYFPALTTIIGYFMAYATGSVSDL